jgi:DHA1 family inner membrane transport protein
MAEALGTSIARVATLQAAFAFACALAGPPLAHVTRNLPRKGLLLATLVLLTLANLLSALAPGFGELMLLRILLGGFGALALPLAMAIGVALTPEAQRPRAVAAIYAGVAFGLMLGVPAGSLVGGAFGWRASFALAAALCALSLLLVAWRVPRLPALPLPPRASALSGRAWGYLGVTLLAFTAMFTLVGFIGPVIARLTGYGAGGIAALQVLIGVSCLLGLRLGAALAGGARGGLPLLFAGIALGLLLLVHPLALGGASLYGLLAMVLSALIAPAAQFGTAPLVQTRLTQEAGPAATFALAMNGSMVYLGQGLGVSLGAGAVALGGLTAAPLTGAMVALAGLALSLMLRRQLAASPA